MATASRVRDTTSASWGSLRLHKCVGSRIVRDHIVKSQEAYARCGAGSARVRRRDVESIYSETAPIPGEVADPPSNEFLKEIRVLIRESIDQSASSSR